MHMQRRGYTMKTLKKASRPARTWCLVILATISTVAGCSWDDLVSSDLPPNVVNPEALRSEEGALALYRGALWAFRRGFGGGNRGYVIVAGRMTDELTTGKYVGSTVPLLSAGSYDELDVRDIP